jgi:hypothetical protein
MPKRKYPTQLSISELREKCGLSPRDVANRMVTTLTTITKTEHYPKDTPLRTLDSYLSALDCTMRVTVSHQGREYELLLSDGVCTTPDMRLTYVPKSISLGGSN